MSKEFFKVPKRERQVSLWIHPEGRVLGSVFVREQSQHHIGEELPLELFNQTEPFIVVHRQDLDEIRFYNKTSIVRVEYEQEQQDSMDTENLPCQLHMMDGSLIEGEISGVMPPDRSRLYDFLNKEQDCFVPLFLPEGRITLINKKYIIYARSL